MKDGVCKLWVRLRYTEHIINGWYSEDGQTWHKYPWGFDMQGYHHNTLGGFLSLRPGIFAGGEGEAKITNFTYRNLQK
jgi:beta-xylosidase